MLRGAIMLVCCVESMAISLIQLRADKHPDPGKYTYTISNEHTIDVHWRISEIRLFNECPSGEATRDCSKCNHDVTSEMQVYTVTGRDPQNLTDGDTNTYWENCWPKDPVFSPETNFSPQECKEQHSFVTSRRTVGRMSLIQSQGPNISENTGNYLGEARLFVKGPVPVQCIRIDQPVADCGKTTDRDYSKHCTSEFLWVSGIYSYNKTHSRLSDDPDYQGRSTILSKVVSKAHKSTDELPFSLCNSTVTNNDLLNDKIRFENVVHGNHKYSLEVQKIGGNYTSDSPDKNGLSSDCYGNINLRCGTTITMKFRLLNEREEAPDNINKFWIGLHDLDQGLNGNCVESVTVYDAYEYKVTSTSKISATEDDLHSAWIFTSTTHGTEDDNPTEEWELLNDAQYDKSAIVLFDPSETGSEFTLVFSTTPGNPDWEATSRNIQFSAIAAENTPQSPSTTVEPLDPWEAPGIEDLAGLRNSAGDSLLNDSVGVKIVARTYA